MYDFRVVLYFPRYRNWLKYRKTIQRAVIQVESVICFWHSQVVAASWVIAGKVTTIPASAGDRTSRKSRRMVSFVRNWCWHRLEVVLLLCGYWMCQRWEDEIGSSSRCCCFVFIGSPLLLTLSWVYLLDFGYSHLPPFVPIPANPQKTIFPSHYFALLEKLIQSTTPTTKFCTIRKMVKWQS